MTGHRQNVVQYPCNLAEHRTNVFCPEWDINPQQSLYGQRVGLLVTHHGDVVQTIEVGQALDVGLIFHQLLCATMEEANVRITPKNSLGKS